MSKESILQTLLLILLCMCIVTSGCDYAEHGRTSMQGISKAKAAKYIVEGKQKQQEDRINQMNKEMAND